MNRVAQELYSLATFPDVQSRPPDEVFERSRLSALEIFSRKQHQRFISIHLDVLLYLVGCERIGGFHGQKVTAAQRSRDFGHTNMVRQPMVVHRDVIFGQGLHEILFGHAAKVIGCTKKDVANFVHFLVGNVYVVAVHPTFDDSQCLGRTQFNQGPKVVGRNQLPSAAHQVKTENLSVVESFLECLGRWLAGTHTHCPAHHTILLGLYGSHMTDHAGRIVELRSSELLVEQSDGRD